MNEIMPYGLPNISKENISIGDKFYQKNREYVCGTDRKGKPIWIEGPLLPRTY